jgi:hypothetical protein
MLKNKNRAIKNLEFGMTQSITMRRPGRFFVDFLMN